NTDTLDLHFGSDLMPIVVQQLPLKLFQLGSRCAKQVLAATTPDRFEVVFADDPTVEDPHPARAAVLAFDHAENGFHRGHIPTIAVEGLITDRKTVGVDDERNHDLFAIGT